MGHQVEVTGVWRLAGAGTVVSCGGCNWKLRRESSRLGTGTRGEALGGACWPESVQGRGPLILPPR